MEEKIVQRWWKELNLSWKEVLVLMASPFDIVFQVYGDLLMTVFGIVFDLPVHRDQSGNLASMTPSMTVQRLVLDTLSTPKLLVFRWISEYFGILVNAIQEFDQIQDSIILLWLLIIRLLLLVIRFFVLIAYIQITIYNVAQALIRGWLRSFFGEESSWRVLSYDSLFKSRSVLEVFGKKFLRYGIGVGIALFLHFFLTGTDLLQVDEQPLNPMQFLPQPREFFP